MCPRLARLSLLLVVACSGEELGPERTGTTEKGLYSVRWTAPDPIPFQELFPLDVTVTDAGGKAVEGATVVVDATMPAHGHGMETVPTVEPKGSGTYRVEGMKFHMRGTWEVKVVVQGAPGEDVAKFQEAFF